MQRLNFTDGTFITLFENSDISNATTPNDEGFFKYLETGVSLGINAINGIITLHSDCVADGTYTKTDANGNIWTFKSGSNESYLEINSTRIISEDSYTIFCLVGDVDTNGRYRINRVYGQRTNDLTFPEGEIGGNQERMFLRYGCINNSERYTYLLSDMIAKCNVIGASTPNGGATRITSNSFIGTIYTTFYTNAPRSDRWSVSYYEISLPFVGSWNADDFLDSITEYTLGEVYEVDPVDGSADPYEGGGLSGTGGGDGTFTGDNDPVDIPTLPTVGAQDAGFISLFAPTIAQLKNLASFMWSDLFDVDTFKKIFNDPMDSILGLSVVPVTVPTSGAREITVGNIVTTVSMNVASQQYIEVDCGSVDFTSKYFGSYLDYEPYTKISIYVPYSGYHDLRADDIMGRVVRMVYHIDILTGSLVAFLKCGDSVLYEFNGACASNIPVTNISYNSTIENAMRIAVNIGTTVATAGASAPLSASGAINMVGSTAEGALSMKPSVGRSGSMGGTTGIMGNQIPYFIITRPRICVPTKQNHYQGYPSFITYTISSLAGKGYTVFDTVLLKDINLTDNEKDELTSILKEGVYL